MACIIIAEIGENHVGDMRKARYLIDKAASSGAQYAKFQSYRPETFRKEDPEYGWFKKVHLKDRDHFMLRDYAEKKGIKFLSTPCSVERAEFLCGKMGMKEIKIASGFIRNFKLLEYINKRAETVFLSTGMADMDEIKEARERLSNVKKCYILHCVSEYPCPDKDVNIKAMKSLMDNFPGDPIGYSDHTAGISACIAAAALGAEVIEKHFTFDKKYKEGTDHVLSALPEEFKKMISLIRAVEKHLGSGIKAPNARELEIRKFVRERFI